MEQKAEPVELKPCPWCDGPAETRNSRWHDTDHWGVACQGCGNPWFDYRAITEAEAIAAWNQRANPQPAAVDGLVEQVSDMMREVFICGADWGRTRPGHFSDYLADAIKPHLEALTKIKQS